jgi:futalosine hydrolase
MEGAGLHYTCRMLQIPFLQLRGISNLVGERNKENWKISLAIEQVNQSLIRLLTRIATEPFDLSSKTTK